MAIQKEQAGRRNRQDSHPTSLALPLLFRDVLDLALRRCPGNHQGAAPRSGVARVIRQPLNRAGPGRLEAPGR